MRLSVVILTWNSEQHIRNCLTSLFDSLDSEFDSYEIFVVDNGSRDQSRAIIENFREKYSRIIKPIYLDFNSGTTYSRNLAIKQATGDFIAILDSDVTIPPGVMECLLDALNEFSDIGMVVPKLIYANGDFQKSTDNFPTIITKFRRYFLLKKIEQDEGKLSPSVNQRVDYAISAFWLLKKEVMEKVGLLDEKIFYAPEDVDYCLRIWRAGYKIVYVPSCVVVHDAQEISRGLRLNRAFWEHIKGLVYYFSKHRYFFRKPCFR